MIHGFFDVREVADICNVRASTIRHLVAADSDLIPRPVYLFDGPSPVWPAAAIACWSRQGFPAGFTYDSDEFGTVAIDQWMRAREVLAQCEA